MPCPHKRKEVYMIQIFIIIALALIGFSAYAEYVADNSRNKRRIALFTNLTYGGRALAVVVLIASLFL